MKTTVIDVSNPASPQRVGGYDTSGYAYGVAASGNFAYVADGTNGLQVIDVSNPATLQRVGGHDTSGEALGVAALFIWPSRWNRCAAEAAGFQLSTAKDAEPAREL